MSDGMTVRELIDGLEGLAQDGHGEAEVRVTVDDVPAFLDNFEVTEWTDEDEGGETVVSIPVSTR